MGEQDKFVGIIPVGFQEVLQLSFNVLQGLEAFIFECASEFEKEAFARIEFGTVRRQELQVYGRRVSDLLAVMGSGVIGDERDGACGLRLTMGIEFVQKGFPTDRLHGGQKQGKQVAGRGAKCRIEIAEVVADSHGAVGTMSFGTPLAS